MEDSTAIIIIFIVITSLVIGGLMGIPLYKVWQKGLSGQAMLKEAEFSKQIQVEQAKADLDSSKLWAKAEVVRAGGVAESTKIISGELQKNEAYLQYLAIQAQMKMAESQNHTTVYIPAGYNGIPLIKDIDK